MSLNDVLSRIQQLQALVEPQQAAPVAATTSTGQDFGSTLAAVTTSGRRR